MAPVTAEEPMKKVRLTEEQMVAILREADKTPVAEVAKKHKLREQTIYNWRRHFGTLEPVDVKRLRALESENAKLKRIVAERDLESTRSRRSTAESGELAGVAKRSYSRVNAASPSDVPASCSKRRVRRCRIDRCALSATRRPWRR
jgi:putative transposase